MSQTARPHRQLSPCLIGMQACSCAHHWAREFAKFGHRVRLMASKFVAPYRMSGKRGENDAAAAICEAVTRPSMRFVPIKTIEQQSRLFVHRARQGYVAQRTALINAASVDCSRSWASCCPSKRPPCGGKTINIWKTCPASPCDGKSLMGKRFGPAPGNARLAQGGQQGKKLL